jgi:enterochelin esterase family protein
MNEGAGPPPLPLPVPPAGATSPRPTALAAALADGHPGALPAFWDEVAAAGAPLVEAIAGEPDHRAVTFLWRDRTGGRGPARPPRPAGTGRGTCCC